MDGLDLNNIPKINFVFDFKGPGGYIPLGYTKYSIATNLLTKLSDPKDEPFTGYYASTHKSDYYKFVRASAFSSYVLEFTQNTNSILTCEVLDEYKKDEYYLVVLESLNVDNLFEYYSDDTFKLEDFFSPNLLKLIKKYRNFKIVFMDSREGAYSHDIKLLEKINDFLDRNSINQSNKVFISTNNNFIKNIKLDKKFKNRINLFPNNNCLLIAGRFISELRVAKNNIFDKQNNYNYSIQENIHFNDREKYYLMYNRNSERLHRTYFVNELYKNDLLKYGYVSLFENEYLDEFLDKEKEYPPLDLNKEDILDIKKNYKNYIPLIIDDSDRFLVSDLHNFLSRKDEYENSYFSIISETNAEKDYCFITEKTTKPISNLHPFLVNGNPHTLKVLKSYGFKTFDRWWDESYDDEFDFKKRTNMVLQIVKKLCSLSKEEWNTLIYEMQDILIFNKKLLNKLWTSKVYQKEFILEIIKEEKNNLL